ncbi:MAG: hypothetical protein A2908_03300 [Candidatus Staskawiczbacteria bacterium RIFCSPLOWO2_01_FULL_38_12b]|uniref:Bacterial Ig-like domain-containing protein n=1 Tax=Candidatus Staskawiczbacteria bacterium RIFCSPLOWO2_01_FULL_38_12b TaxID=1802214 RepID=A0A1G2ICH6_9BACT|nr:MAG: hypothetical protein A2908_03300 [Candidatus Staskawiczbacteria bacterium RIFCSPLOWO2_01_FULL_38_12b]
MYNLILPPPQGPIVSSETHSDQSKWYANKNVILRWASTSAIENYSYVLDKDPAGSPDNIAEGNNATVIYKNLDDGTQYFHIKSFRDGTWGGVTSFGINIDTQPPAEFLPEFAPSSRTSSKNQIIKFQTSDAFSGTLYYEIKVIPLSPKSSIVKSNNNFFIEATSPYQTALDIGKYDIIVRAYDGAGNYREVTSRLNVVTPIFEIVSDQGIKVVGSFIIPWLWFWIASAIVAGILLLNARRIKRWHDSLATQQKNKELPQDVKSQFETLKTYRKKYGNLVLLLIFASSLFFVSNVRAQETEQARLSPPFVSSVSRNISNEEIFYVGGKTDNSDITVVIYLQNLQTGATFNESVVSDSKGNWFYRHSTFLGAGEYLLWMQSKLGEESSPPSPQIQMTVKNTAIQFGASRFSYELIYLMVAIIFLSVILGLIAFIMYYAYHGRKKHKLFLKEVKEAQESVRRGFAVLRRDIQAEFTLVKKMKAEKALSEEEKLKEEQLLKDLQSVEQYIGKEIWDIEENESFG